MTPGLPGAGVSGLFYLIAALLTPAWELFRAYRGDAAAGRFKLAFRHFVLATCVLCGVWAMAWIIGALATSPLLVGRGAGAAAINTAYAQVLGRRVALFTAITLATVLGAVELLRVVQLVLRHRRQDAQVPSGSRAPRALPAPATATDDAA